MCYGMAQALVEVGSGRSACKRFRYELREGLQLNYRATGSLGGWLTSMIAWIGLRRGVEPGGH